MAVISNGVLTKSTQFFTPASWNGIPQPGITPRGWAYPGTFELGSYGAIYRRQPWVAAVVDKIADAEARLPLKVYRREGLDRPEAGDHPYAVLLRRPSSIVHPYLFRQWTRSTLELYGEAVWVKIRDRGGRPVELAPWHPTRLFYDEEREVWELDTSKGRVEIKRHDFVFFRRYNPDSLIRGLSRLEPLRSTLENEEGARRANSALWRNGGRPSVALRHPKTLGGETVKRLRAQWDEVHGGVDNWAKAVVLEEGMDAQVLPLNVEELQYVEGRKMNREEVCGVFDMPPPAVHILDRATFSNITEQARMLYRDTMAPRLKATESTLEHELRDGRMGRNVPPDFGDDVYAEYLMDEVLRGDFEARATAYQQADYMTMAEKRRAENLPFIEGTDRIFVNAATVPLDAAAAQAEQAAAAERVPLELVRSVMGRLSRPQSIEEVDVAGLVQGLPQKAATAVLGAVASAVDLPDLRLRVRELSGGV